MADIDNIKNRIGGLPVWLDPRHPMPATLCKSCSNPMVLLLELYCPEDYPEAAFHRVIYVFACKNGSCHRDLGSGFKIYRSQMELMNAVYDYDGLLKTDLQLENMSLSTKEGSFITNYCIICGSLAISEYAGNNGAQYCSKSHSDQITNQTSEMSIVVSRQSILFAELLLDEEPEPERTFVPVEEDILNSLEVVEIGDSELIEEDETESEVDKEFLKFQKRLSRMTDQVLRYGRVNPVSNEEPLWIASKACLDIIPPCTHCLAARTFEFQILPQMLAHLDIDNTQVDSLDWGTVAFYTCSLHCEGANGKYAEEHWIRQNISPEGLGDSIRKVLHEHESGTGNT